MRQDWSDSAGSFGYVDYDGFGWPLLIFNDFNGSTSITDVLNTYSGADLLTDSVATTQQTGGITTTEYDACERSLFISIDSDGTGGNVFTSTVDWTYSVGCLPSTATQTFDWVPDVHTTTFDEDGRILRSDLVIGATLNTLTWSWDCP